MFQQRESTQGRRASLTDFIKALKSLSALDTGLRELAKFPWEKGYEKKPGNENPSYYGSTQHLHALLCLP